jgi:predicted nucleotidyltransferase
MPDDRSVNREAILHTLATALEPLPFVDAMWEGGAAAFDRLDEWSDIDLYIVAADDRIEETFRAVEDALQNLSPIRRKYEPTWPAESGIAQAFYRLERASEYLLVDLAVLKRSAPDKFLEPELHGRAIFSFNKGGALSPPPLDADGFVKKLVERRDRLVLRMEIFGPFVTKELHRRNWLGALDAYHRIVLDSLIQVLRMRHYPAHYSFSVRYVYFELPPDVVRRLEGLSFVRSPEELPAMYREAIEWFQEEAAGVTADLVRLRMRGTETDPLPRSPP